MAVHGSPGPGSDLKWRSGDPKTLTGLWKCTNGARGFYLINQEANGTVEWHAYNETAVRDRVLGERDPGKWPILIQETTGATREASFQWHHKFEGHLVRDRSGKTFVEGKFKDQPDSVNQSKGLVRFEVQYTRMVDQEIQKTFLVPVKLILKDQQTLDYKPSTIFGSRVIERKTIDDFQPELYSIRPEDFD